MEASIEERHGVRVHRLPADGPRIETDADTSDLIGNAWYLGAETVVVPVERLSSRFLDLRTGFAGELLRKTGNYRVRLVVLGDVSAAVGRSEAFRAFVAESNRGQQVWFVADDGDLDARLARLT